MSFQELFSELKRRRVFRVAGIYLVGAFVALQVAQLLIESLKLPPWILTALTVVALIAFPLVVALAWAFDVTPEGVQRTAPSGNSRAIAWAGVGIIIALVGFGAYMQFDHRSSSKAESNALSVAVLPFVNMSGDKEQEYFGDGITEEILNVLAKIPDLRVPARTSSFSFKNKDVPVSQIAQQLKVHYVLEGSVRRSAEQVRITAQLIDATSDRHLWSETYDRTVADIFAVQGEIATAIAQQLNLRMQAAVTPGTSNARAHEAYLKGLYYLNARQQLLMAVSEFKNAIAEDPRYADAYAGLALTYSLLPQWLESQDVRIAIREGKAAAQRALELQPRNAAAHAALGEITGELEWNWPAAQQHLDEAIRADPRYPTAHQWRAELYMIRGDFDRALTEFDRAIELDPLSEIIASMRACAVVELGRTEEGLAILRQLAAANPGGAGQAELARVLFELTRWDERYAMIQRKNKDKAANLKLLIDASRNAAYKPAAMKMLANNPPNHFVAVGYLGLGERDSAAAALDRMADSWSPLAAWPAHSGAFKTLRDHPLFQEYVRKLNL